MDKPGSVSGKQLCRILEKDGYVFVRQTSSHRIYQKNSEDGNITIPIPVHSNKPLKKGTFHAILKKREFQEKGFLFCYHCCCSNQFLRRPYSRSGIMTFCNIICL